MTFAAPPSASPPTPSDTVLETRTLVAGYEAGLPIVKGIDFQLRKGAFVTILGPNGAGKSTFVKAIAGLVPKFSGDVLLNGKAVTAAAPHHMIRSGLAFVPQTENIFATMTIRENLQLCAAILPDRALLRQRTDAAYAMFPDLARRPGLLAGSLSGGQRQMLATARALLADPSVLILDEPSAGLSPKLVAEVFGTIATVRRTGVAIVLVEQNVRAALRIADDALVLVEGRVRHHGPAADLVDNPALGAMFLGDRSGINAETGR
ncbi:MAG: ABC transporter ATP-binding protein [Rhizobiaceae bacterium]|nr:MAG: ABC transporter ATP-binding protein [Rhizobiaceae bacterium]